MTQFGRKKLTQASMAFAVAFSTLAACQQSHHPKIETAKYDWQVIESVGDARIENDHSPYALTLRPGDEIAESGRIITSGSSHLILSRGDVQLTASGDSSITLPANMSPSALSHDYGSVRVRLATAANAAKLITTPHLTASGTNAVLELQVDDQESLITIKSGSVELSTTDGDHHAKLAAGASARLGAQTNGQLEIRPAAGMPFRPNLALQPFQPDENVSLDQGPAKPEHGIDLKAMLSNEAEVDRRPATLREVVILPAARPKIITTAPETEAMDKESSKHDMPDQPTEPPAPMKAATIDDDAPADQTKLQQQFDGLTEGLLGSLPTAEAHN